MRALVTGGCGFIGSHLVERLVNDGHSVQVPDNLSTGRLSNLGEMVSDGLVTFYEGAVQDGNSPDVVIETSGAREMVELGYHLVQSGGRCFLFGVTPHDQPVSIDTLPLHFDTVLTGSKGGGARPEIYIPRTARLAENGLFRMQDLPITLLPLDAINNGIDELRGGRPGRILIDMEA